MAQPITDQEREVVAVGTLDHTGASADWSRAAPRSQYRISELGSRTFAGKRWVEGCPLLREHKRVGKMPSL